ncbi:MAG: YebC/PmpR family DNA-binding transcriptional regulator [Solirubrobacteraceae bacterium]
MGRAFEYRKASKFARWDRMAKQFSRIGREIAIAVKENGPNPEANTALKRAIQNAKGVNMPKDNVERAIKKASGENAENWEEVTYEGYGKGGVAFFIECTTNNTTRTVANIRAIFNKFEGGSLGKNGELSFLFDRKGIFIIETKKNVIEAEQFELEMIDARAEDVDFGEDEIFITSAFEDFGSVQSKLEKLKIEIKSANLERLPTILKQPNADDAKILIKMLDKFNDDDDVFNVFHNIDFSEEIT